jgi:hypothetical protein
MKMQVALIIGADATGCFDCAVLEPQKFKHLTEFI